MVPPLVEPRGILVTDLRQPRLVRLLLERHDLPVVVEPEDAHLGRITAAHRLRRDGDVGASLDVRFDQFTEVHPIEMVAGEDQEVLGVVPGEVAGGLAHGIGGALEPVRALRGLLGGEHFDESVGEHIEPVGLGDVAIE